MNASAPAPLGGTPPYSLEPVAFALPALAAAASGAQLGGDREMGLATYMIARLALAMLPSTELSLVERTLRAERARQWLSALTMPGPARMALLRAIDATVHTGVDAAAAIRELMQLLKGHTSDAALAELGALAERLRLYYEVTL